MTTSTIVSLNGELKGAGPKKPTGDKRNLSFHALFPFSPQKQRILLSSSIFVLAVCAFSYEISIATLASYRYGNAATQFSLSIGLFLCAMGIGSWIAKPLLKHALYTYVIVEVLLSWLGGFSVFVLEIFFLRPFFFPFFMVFFVCSIGTSIGLELPLLMHMIRVQHGGKGATVLSHALGLDYLGSLLASFIFPLFLMPKLGLIFSTLCLGGLNALVAFITSMGISNHPASTEFREQSAPPFPPVWRGLVFISFVFFIGVSVFISLHPVSFFSL